MKKPPPKRSPAKQSPPERTFTFSAVFAPYGTERFETRVTDTAAVLEFLVEAKAHCCPN